MARRLKSRAGEPAGSAQAALDSFVGPTRGAKKKKGVGSRRAKYIEEVADRMKRKDWEGMTAGRLVALYWLCHERVYGTVPVELDKATTWETAMMGAGRMVTDHFDGDVQRAVVFMRWVWTREAGYEDWRRKNSKFGRRITWQNQFRHDHLISDWRAAAMRQQG